MAFEPPTKKAKSSTDVTASAVSGSGIHFTPEIIARMTTFADANNSPDVMNICLAAGPAASRTIKHFYLRRNETYLIGSLVNLYIYKPRKRYNTEAVRREKAGANHRAWMEVNTDWKTTAVSADSISEIHLYETIMDGSHPFIAFNNVAFAVELGLLEVVKFLIEDKGVDPNEYGWTSYDLNYRFHPVSAAMTCGQKDVFQYLLSLLTDIAIY